MPTNHVLLPIEAPYQTDIAQILEGYPKDESGYILKLFRVFANSKRFLGGRGPANLLDKASPLTLRQREIVILRVTANLGCEYEWGVHVAVFAQAAGFSQAEIQLTHADTVDATTWSEEESLLLACVDDLCQQAKISDANYARFQAHWTVEQQLEILALCGHYHLISFVANTARLAPETGAPPFPKSAGRQTIV